MWECVCECSLGSRNTWCKEWSLSLLARRSLRHHRFLPIPSHFSKKYNTSSTKLYNYFSHHLACFSCVIRCHTKCRWDCKQLFNSLLTKVKGRALKRPWLVNVSVQNGFFCNVNSKCLVSTSVIWWLIEVVGALISKPGFPPNCFIPLLFSAELKPSGYCLELFWQADLGYIEQAIIGVKVPNSSRAASIQHWRVHTVNYRIYFFCE